MLTSTSRPDPARPPRWPWAVGALVLLVALVVWRTSSPSAPTTTAQSSSGRPTATTPSRDRTNDARRARKGAPPAERPSDDEAPRVDPGADAPPPREADDPAVVAVLAAASDTSASGTRSLIASLTSTDEIVVAEAANALVEREATEAIVPLSKIELETAAGSGLSIIDALGRLAAVAGEDDKAVAVDRLLEMLAQEKARGARESAANLLQIYEALGLTKDPKAAAPLEAELLDPTVPRAAKVLIVGALVAIGQKSSRAALESAYAEQSAARGADSFEEEIRAELVGVIAKALEGL